MMGVMIIPGDAVSEKSGVPRRPSERRKKDHHKDYR